MVRGVWSLTTGLGLAALGGLLAHGLVHAQRHGPGAAHAGAGRPAAPTATRRDLMRWALLGALAVVGAQASLAAVRYAWPMRTAALGAAVAVPLAQVPAVGGPPLRHEAGRFYLVREAEGLLALSWTCTHLGCIVPWQPAEGRFHCPCHQSQFDRQGRVLAGPATRPLDLLPIRLAGDTVLVDSGTIVRRAEVAPDQLTPLA
jgi:cytochrome b6-f complex iron-sulfur subunit